MVVEQTVGHSKGLIGAFFLQYTIYSMLYIAEGCRYQKLRASGLGPTTAREVSYRMSMNWM